MKFELTEYVLIVWPPWTSTTWLFHEL